MESWTYNKNLKVTSIIQLIQAKLLQDYEVTKFLSNPGGSQFECHQVGIWANALFFFFTFSLQVKNLLDQYDTNKLEQVSLAQFKVFCQDIRSKIYQIQFLVRTCIVIIR